MKFCSKCQTEKDRSEFSKRSERKDGLQSICRICDSNRAKAAYRANKTYQYNTIERSKVKKSQRRAWFIELKKTLCCAKCGDKRWYVLDFHHTGDDEKSDNVSKLVWRGFPIKVILEEVKKCIVLCANCHRELHYEANLSP